MTEAGIWINLGAGDPEYHAPPPWINIDARPVSRPDVLADMTALPFGFRTVGRAYAGHVLEHVALDAVISFLCGLADVMARGGQLMVAGPDAAAAGRLFADGRIDRDRLFADGIDPKAGEDPALHRWDCSAAAAFLAMEAAGFVDIVQIAPADVDRTWPLYDRVAPDQFVVWGHL